MVSHQSTMNGARLFVAIGKQNTSNISSLFYHKAWRISNGPVRGNQIICRGYSNTSPPLVIPQWKKIVSEKNLKLEEIQHARLSSKRLSITQMTSASHWLCENYSLIIFLIFK